MGACADVGGVEEEAKSQGLWNMFLPNDSAELAGEYSGGLAGGLTNRQYAENLRRF